MAFINFDAQVAELISELRAVSREMQEEADKIVSDFIDDTFIPTLKHNSSVSQDDNKKRYSNGWVKKKNANQKYYWVSNKNHPELTHILENGFERTYTNKTTGRARKIYRAEPRAHINPAIVQTESILLERLKNKLI